MIGKGGKPSPFGTQVTEESGSLAPLGKYRQKSVILNLPPTTDVSEIDWFSIWSQSLQSSLAEVTFLHKVFYQSLETPRTLFETPSFSLKPLCISLMRIGGLNEKFVVSNTKARVSDENFGVSDENLGVSMEF